MAKASINTGEQAQAVHTRTTAGTEESQAVVIAIDGSDSVVPADTGNGLDVDVTRVQGNVAVTGTFFQATQPVSLASVPSHAVTDGGGSLTVDGTFWQATQPVSLASAVPVTDNGGTLSVDDGAGSLTVDGSVSVSNFPATQPVSIASMPSTPVTGTFWQATQPVSLAAAPSTPVTQGTSPWVTQDTTAKAADVGALPSLLNVVAGYDGTNVRALGARLHDGVVMVQTNDQKVRQELEHIHLLLLEQTTLLRQLLGERADIT